MMAKVTDLKLQKKRSHRISVYIDGVYCCGLDVSQVADLELRIGKEVNDADIKQIKQASTYGKLYERTIRWLMIRKRSEWEVNTYLNRVSDDVNAKDVVLKKLHQLGYVDDQEFAESWVNNRRALKASSRRKLEQELQAKRVPRDIIRDVLRSSTDDMQAIHAVIEKKRRMTRYQDDHKLMQYLSRQGFAYGDIKKALFENDSL